MFITLSLSAGVDYASLQTGDRSRSTYLLVGLAGRLEVQTTSDDDFFGFVLGYDAGDLFGSNPTTDYILVDWKQGTQKVGIRTLTILYIMLFEN
ncbi:hypothetical protein GCM10022278_28150 [Allohahella marinimesophila]|uniref:TSP C-terminal domain-containing protein n=1 Tax=Allohahella marinimesophila TaxID=1054972 RepID=A0ABP7PQF6_9GAMM